MSRPPRFEAVLFDLDGTLVDSESLHEEVDRGVFAECGVEVADADWPAFKGRPSLDVFADVQRRYGGSMTAAEMAARKQALMIERAAGIQLLPGARALVDDLRRQGMPLALVTSTDRAIVDCILASLKLSFDAVVTADDVRHTKPDPDPYLRGAAALDVSPAACLVAEDSLSGIRSGRAAGCYVVAIPTSFDEPALLEAGAHRVLPDLPAIHAWLLGG